MKNIFFIIVFILFLVACKTQKNQSINTYSTSSHVSTITVDLPRNSKPPVVKEVAVEKPEEILKEIEQIERVDAQGNLAIQENTIEVSSKKEADSVAIKPKKEKKKKEENKAPIEKTTPKQEDTYRVEVSNANLVVETGEKEEKIEQPSLYTEELQWHLGQAIDSSNESNKEEDLPAEVIEEVKSMEKTEGEMEIGAEIEALEGVETLDASRFSWEVGIRSTQILDVRTLKEYKNGHIFDAIHIGVDDPSFKNQLYRLDNNNPVAVYSNSGVRSLKAAQILKENGFLIIYNLEGGLNEWRKEGREIVR